MGLIFSGVFAFFLMILLFGFVWIKAHTDGIENLRARLHYYADMKNKEDAKNSMSSIDGPLSSEEHVILLGILKKVEAKNAALMKMWTFISAALLSIIFSKSDKMIEIEAFLISLLLMCMPFLLATLVGVRQIDQIDFWLISKKVSAETAVRDQMQKALMQDLLRKENVFRFALLGAFVFLPFALISPILWKIFAISAN